MSVFPIFPMIFIIVLFLGCESQETGQPLLTIQLGGQSCEMYQGALNATLTELPGVEQTDFTSKKRHVLVRGNPDVMNAQQILNAINGLHGEGWSCEGNLVD